MEDAALLLDSVIVLDGGRVTEVCPVDDLTRGTAVVEGASAAVASLLEDGQFPVLREDAAAGRRRVTLATSVEDAGLDACARDLGLRLSEPDLRGAGAGRRAVMTSMREKNLLPWRTHLRICRSSVLSHRMYLV